MRTRASLIGLGLALMAMSAAAQTTVTSSGTTATTGNVPYVSAATTTSTTIQPSPITVSGSNVGIGTTTPQYPLDVLGTAAPWAAFRLQSYEGIGTYPAAVYGGQVANMYGYIGSGNYYNSSLWRTGNTAASDILFNNDGSLSFTSDTGLTAQTAYTPTARMSILNNGNVGIGTTSPGAALEVNGTGIKLTANSGGSMTYADGSVQTTAWNGVLNGGDYAEDMRATGKKEKYGPGDVLVLAQGDNTDVQKSAEPYSTMVAGIYATKPGVVGRREEVAKSADNIPMAMVGVVPTKVSAENGPIRKGDLLVTASMSGYAMKGTDRNRMLGAVLGKAMGSLDSGTGVIEVLVTLQ